MATTVRITETYDMKTTLNKIGLVGIHTPMGNLITRLYPGLVKNHKFVRFLRCDVTGACASVLPADPLQVGVSAGDVAPEDMFNPILYKAVTNDAFDSLIAYMRDGADVTTLNSLNNNELGGLTTAFKAYYAMLSENGKFRKAMPQSGFSIRGLVPICHTLISTYGNTARPGNLWTVEKTGDETEEEHPVPNLADVEAVDGGMTGDGTVRYSAITFRGKSVRMPKLPLHYKTENPYDQSDTPYIPKTYVLAMVLPPARLHEFYYRMRITWTIRFEDVITTLPTSNLTSLANTGNVAYGSNYTYSSSKADLGSSEDMVDTEGVDISKIMES